MTPEQERLAQQLIDVIKRHEGVYNYKEFQPLWEGDKGSTRISVIRSLRESGFIEDVNGTTIRLTTKGWAFLGFDTQRQLDQKEKEKQDQISDLTLRKLKLEQFPVKFWWLLLLISAAISILTTVISNKITQNINQSKSPAKEQSLSPLADSTKNQ